jgi:site-specific DNA-cytosine methylase
MSSKWAKGTSGPAGDEHHNLRAHEGGVRRLTPLECERLQGLPDGWTCLCGGVTTEACECPDGPRYKAIGNGGVVPCVEWIARRVAAVHGSGR